MPGTYLITGAARGLGIELVRQLAARGDTVIAAVRSRSSPGDLAATKAELIELDVSNAVSIESAASALRGRPIDVLINNAGVTGDDKTIATITFTEFQRVFATNVYGAAVLTRTLLPNLVAAKGRKVVNISSELGSISTAGPGFSYAYCTSKAALNMLSSLMAKELAQSGVIVVPVSPGWNRTDMGGPAAPLDSKDTMAQLIAVIDRLKPSDSGHFLDYDGKILPW
ncbi:MAG: SDR family oxidoreductase [Phycisphaerales bacterium]